MDVLGKFPFECIPDDVAGGRIPLDEGRQIDAIVTPEPGKITFPILQRLAGAGFAVTEDEVLHAMALAFKRLKIIVEPGGAVALAAALFHGAAIDRDTVIAVTSGGNVDTDLFALALQRFG